MASRRFRAAYNNARPSPTPPHPQHKSRFGLMVPPQRDSAPHGDTEYRRVVEAARAMRALLRERFFGETEDVHATLLGECSSVLEETEGVDAASPGRTVECASGLEQNTPLPPPSPIWRVTVVDRRAPASRRFREIEAILQAVRTSVPCGGPGSSHSDDRGEGDGDGGGDAHARLRQARTCVVEAVALEDLTCV